ncbi:MAG: TSUP family transporter [Solirubrobacterales bacterium]
MSELLAMVVGWVAGLVAGLLGVGGGVLFVPALTLLLDEPQLRAEATSLLAIVPVAIVGAVRQRAYGNLDLRAGLLLGVFSPVGVLVGVVVANAVPQRALELGFAALLVFVSVRLAASALRADSGSGDDQAHAGRRAGAAP